VPLPTAEPMSAGLDLAVWVTLLSGNGCPALSPPRFLFDAKRK
jgi:hypothetical protein